MAGMDEVLERLMSDAGFQQELASDPARALAGYDLTADDLEVLSSQFSLDVGGESKVEQRTSKAGMVGLLGSLLGGGGGGGGGAARLPDEDAVPRTRPAALKGPGNSLDAAERATAIVDERPPDVVAPGIAIKENGIKVDAAADAAAAEPVAAAGPVGSAEPAPGAMKAAVPIKAAGAMKAAEPIKAAGAVMSAGATVDSPSLAVDGEPIPGIDVKLGKNQGGAMAAQSRGGDPVPDIDVVEASQSPIGGGDPVPDIDVVENRGATIGSSDPVPGIDVRGGTSQAEVSGGDPVPGIDVKLGKNQGAAIDADPRIEGDVGGSTEAPGATEGSQPIPGVDIIVKKSTR